MDNPKHSPTVLPPSERLDLLAVGPLPYRLDGRPAFQFGGVLWAASLLGGLAELGHVVRAIATGPPQPNAFEPGDLGPDIAVDWFAVDFMLIFEPPSPEDVRTRRAQLEIALDRALADRRPDLVLLGFESGVFYAPDLCRERGLPTVLFSHGIPLPEGSYPPEALEALVADFAKVDLIVTVAHHLEANLRSLGLSHVRTIRTGIDNDAFSPRPKDAALLEALGIDGGRFVVGSFSRMRPAKRVADLVASAELVLRTEPRCIYLVAGDCPDRPALMELVEAKGLSESFRFVGELDYASVPAYMALCDVVVLASEHEGFGLNVLEAQACGRAVIASDIPALRELVDGRETGLRFQVGDAGELAARTLELAHNPQLRQALGNAARDQSLANGKERWLRACSDALVKTAQAHRVR